MGGGDGPGRPRGQKLELHGTTPGLLLGYGDSGEECLWDKAFFQHFSVEIKFEDLCFTSSLEQRLYFAFSSFTIFSVYFSQAVGPFPLVLVPWGIKMVRDELLRAGLLQQLSPSFRPEQTNRNQDSAAGTFPSPSWNQSVLCLQISSLETVAA